MPKIQKNKIEQCTKIFIYRDLKVDFDQFSLACHTMMQSIFAISSLIGFGIYCKKKASFLRNDCRNSMLMTRHY